MKKLILVILVAAFLAGCKKSTTPPSQVFLSKVYEDGNPSVEYTYNSNGELDESKNYTEQGGVISVSGRTKYIYDIGGKLTQSISYSMPSNTVGSSSHFILYADGKISRRSYYYGTGSDSGEVYLHIDHKYNNAGKIVRQTWRETDESVTSYREFTYYDNGNMKSIESFQVSGGVTEKFYKYIFALSDATLPPTFVRPVAIPVNYYLDYWVSNKVELFSYEDDVLNFQSENYVSDRKFNKHGFVIAYKMTAKHILPVNPDQVTEMAFDFTTR